MSSIEFQSGVLFVCNCSGVGASSFFKTTLSAPVEVSEQTDLLPEVRENSKTNRGPIGSVPGTLTKTVGEVTVFTAPQVAKWSISLRSIMHLVNIFTVTVRLGSFCME